MTDRDSIDSRLTESGRAFPQTGMRTANLPVYRASTVLFDSLAEAVAMGARTMAGERHASTYGTVGTPTSFALTDALAEIEGAGQACRAALMPSGLLAINAALLAYLRPGDHMLMSDSVYGPARTFAQGMLTELGVRTTFYAPEIDAESLARLIEPGTRVLYLESPGSYTFEIQDVPALCALARERGLISIIDNAWASPTFARPFDWGVDVSVLPLTKYWGGHSDLLMGAAVVREPLWPALFRVMRQFGICVGGDDAFLVLRGLRTAAVRMRQHEANALALARWLRAQPEVARVLHPALEDHPQHALWRRDFTGSSGLFAFELDRALFGDDQAGALASGRRDAALAALCERRRFFGIGYSWGGYESLIMPAKIGSLRSVTPWRGGALIRVHAGLEGADDLVADLACGFDRMRESLRG